VGCLQIETFCFEAGGSMNVTVEDFTARGRDGKPAPGVRAGFLMVIRSRSAPIAPPVTTCLPCLAYLAGYLAAFSESCEKYLLMEDAAPDTQ